MAQLDEQPVHAQQGGLLPAEGAPEEHEGGGAVHPEESEGGPLIPADTILDFTTRRLVPFALPDDPAAASLPPPPPPGWEDEEDEEPEESFTQRAQNAVREVMTMPPTWQPPAGWQEPEALLPPVHGAPVHAMDTRYGAVPKGRRRKRIRTKGGAVTQSQRVTDERTGKTGHWVTNRQTGEHLFIADDGLVYHSDTPVEVAEQQQQRAAGAEERNEEARRHYERTPGSPVVDEDTDALPAAGLLPERAGQPMEEEEGEDGGEHPQLAGEAEGRVLRSARGTGGVATAKWRAGDKAAGHQTAITQGRHMRDFSTSHPVRRREVDNVLYYFDRASPEQKKAGEQWYPMARSIAERWAALSRLPLSRVVGIIAAASPQTPWDEVSLINNLQQAHECIFGGGTSGHWTDSPKIPERGHVPDPETGELRWKGPNTTGGKMQAIKEGTPVDQVLNGRKVWNFYLTIMGVKPDARRAVVDRHMIAIIRGANPDGDLDLNEAEYDRYARTIEVAARERNVAPEIMQAVAWLKYQQDYAPQVRADKRAKANQKRSPGADGTADARGRASGATGGHLVVPRNAHVAATQLIAAGHYTPEQHAKLVEALHQSIMTGAWIPPDYDPEASRREMEEGPWAPNMVAHYQEHYPEEYAHLKKTRPELFAREKEPIKPGWRIAQVGERPTGGHVREADEAMPAPQPGAQGGHNLLDLRRDRRTGGHAREEHPDDRAQEGESEKQGWLTIRREVEGEDGKPEEQMTRIYVGHDGMILAGPDHLIGRALTDLRGEGSLEGRQGIPGMRPEPYHSTDHQTGGPSPFQDEGKTLHGQEGRELDSWRSHERSRRLFQPEDHLNSLVRRGYIGAADAQDLLKQAKADQSERAGRARGL